jgi:hypothetical protein
MVYFDFYLVIVSRVRRKGTTDGEIRAEGKSSWERRLMRGGADVAAGLAWRSGC